MLRIVVHFGIGIAALVFLIYAVYWGTDWAEIAATFFFGWFCGKAHGCCSVCKHTSKCEDDLEEHW